MVGVWCVFLPRAQAWLYDEGTLIMDLGGLCMDSGGGLGPAQALSSAKFCLECLKFEPSLLARPFNRILYQIQVRLHPHQAGKRRKRPTTNTSYNGDSSFGVVSEFEGKWLDQTSGYGSDGLGLEFW